MPDPAFERRILRTLAEHIPHRIYAKDTEGRFVFANQAVARGMGAGHPDQLLGETGRRLRTLGIDDVLRVFAVQHRPGLTLDSGPQVESNTVAKLHGAFGQRRAIALTQVVVPGRAVEALGP